MSFFIRARLISACSFFIILSCSICFRRCWRSSSFSAVIGLGANQTSYSSDNMDSEGGSSQEATLHPVSAIDVDEDLDERYFTY